MTAIPAEPARIAISVRGLQKSFKSFLGRKQQVLGGIDLEIGRGEVVGLIGPNGAGKTTLMSCLLGFLFPDSGQISIDGSRNDDLAVRRRTGFVPERMNFDRRSTGPAFLRYMGRLAGLPKGDAESRTFELMSRFGLAAAGNKRLSQYSRGMLQRIGMCQALIGSPDFLFLDEPTSGLDPSGVILFRDAILEEKRRGTTVLLNSHQLSEVERVCDRVLFLSGGVISQRESLKEESGVKVAISFLPGGFDPLAFSGWQYLQFEETRILADLATQKEIAPLLKALIEGGVTVTEVKRRTADLEEMFRGGP